MAALGAGGSATGGSAAVEVTFVVLASTPCAVVTSIPATGAGLVLIPVGNAWNWTRVLGDIRVDVDRPTDLAAVPARLTVELDEWLAALPYAKAGTADGFYCKAGRFTCCTAP